jgi:hypothetical protein
MDGLKYKYIILSLGLSHKGRIEREDFLEKGD